MESKQISVKLFYFSLPIIIWIIFIWLLDPYRLFNNNFIIPLDFKKRISYRLDYPLWKLIGYCNHPEKNILIGDSRMDKLSVDSLKAYTGKEFSNLAYGGASFREMIETIRLVISKSEVNSIYIGLNLNNYSSYMNGNRVKKSRIILNNNLFYFINKSVVKSIFTFMKEKISNEKVVVEIPPMSKDEFWKFQITSTANEIVSNYSYPKKELKDLELLVEECKEKNIVFKCIILPTHIDLYNQIEGKLIVENQKFLNDISEILTTVNLNEPSEFTMGKENFSDPFHYLKEAQAFIIEKAF